MCNNYKNLWIIKLEPIFYYDHIMLQLSSLCFRNETLIARKGDQQGEGDKGMNEMRLGYKNERKVNLIGNSV
jgi:hypothetical protein